MQNQIVWFYLPVTDIDRAIQFYAKVLDTKISKSEFGESSMGVFDHDHQSVGGCLVFDKHSKPSQDGAMLFFGVEGRLSKAEAIAKELGAQIIEPKHQLGPHGYRSVLIDLEGNKIALHSNSDS